jgi:hypothetical protein
VVLRFNLAVILVVTAIGAVWIEGGHRVVIDAPAEGESAAAIVAAAACPDTDTVPYSTACLDYLHVRTEPEAAPQVIASLPAPCPDNDQVPYSPSCIAFLKGATEIGMRWRATAGAVSLPGPQ